MRRSLGFTLIELMVTIAVLAVIAMIAAPSF
ncbi:type IV pilin protein, partial [Acinetobacter sp. Colony158]